MPFAAVLTDKYHQVGMQVAVFYKRSGIFENCLIEIGNIAFFHDLKNPGPKDQALDVTIRALIEDLINNLSKIYSIGQIYYHI